MGPVSHRFHDNKLYECSRYHSPLLAFSHTPDRETLQQKELNLQGQLGLPGAQRWPPRGRQKYVLLFLPVFVLVWGSRRKSIVAGAQDLPGVKLWEVSLSKGEFTRRIFLSKMVPV